MLRERRHGLPMSSLNPIAIEHTRLAYYADFVIYLIAILLLSSLLRHYTSTALRWAIPLAGLAGLLMWSLIEYAMHQFVFHGLEPFHCLYVEHHRRPLALIVRPTLVSVLLTTILVWLPAILLIGLWLGSGFALGVTTGYFVYVVVHHSVHHWHANSPWMRQRKRQHAIHQHNSRVNYGVTMLWWDYLFGSSQKPDRSHFNLSGTAFSDISLS